VRHVGSGGIAPYVLNLSINHGFLEVYKYMMYCLVVLPVSLHCMSNSEYLISGLFIMSKSELMIYNFAYILAFFL
jgi:hypothetical protein